MAGVDLKNVRKIYPNGAEAVRGVDMQINVEYLRCKLRRAIEC